MCIFPGGFAVADSPAPPVLATAVTTVASAMVSVMAQSEQKGNVPRSYTATDADAGPAADGARRPALGTIDERASAHSRSQSSGAQFPAGTVQSVHAGGSSNDAAPVVRYKVHEQVKKGEDFYLVDEALTVRGTACTLYCVSGPSKKTICLTERKL